MALIEHRREIVLNEVDAALVSIKLGYAERGHRHPITVDPENIYIIIVLVHVGGEQPTQVGVRMVRQGWKATFLSSATHVHPLRPGLSLDLAQRVLQLGCILMTFLFHLPKG